MRAVSIIVSAVAAAILGALTDWLLRLLLPERPKLSHLVAAILTFVVLIALVVLPSLLDNAPTLKPDGTVVLGPTQQIPLLPETLVPQSVVLGPTQQIPVLLGTPVPQSVEVISPADANRVVELARWGRGGINGFAWSSDSRSIIVATTIGLYLYKAESLELIDAIQENEWFNSVVSGPDGRFIVSGDYNGNVILWNKNGALVDKVYSVGGYIYSVAISPNSAVIAALSSEDEILLVDVASKEIKYRFDAHVSGGEVKFSPDGTLLALGDYDGLSIYSVIFGRSERVLASGWVQTFDFLPDGKTVVAGNTNGDLLLWNIEDGNLVTVLERYENDDQFADLVVSPDGQTLIVSRSSGNIDLWDLPSQQKRPPFPSGNVNEMLYSPNGDFLISSTYDGFLQLWATGDWGKLAQIEGFAQFYDAYLTGDNSVFVDPAGPTAFELSLSSGQVLYEFDCPGLCVKSRRGNLLANIDSDDLVSVRDIVSDEKLFTFDEKVYVFGGSGSMAFDSSNKSLAAGGVSGDVYVWDLLSGNLSTTLEHGDECWVRFLTFDRDGTRLAVGTDCGLYLWDVVTTELLYHLEENTMVRGISFSPDDRLVAAEGGLWDISSGSLVYELGTGITSGVAFSPYGDVLALSGRRALVLVDVSSGKEVARLGGHTLWTNTIHFDSTGKYLISTSDDNTVRIWGIP